MLKRIFPILLVLAVFLTACGAPATPTMNPADVQNTAVSAAWTMVAATELAKPTATLPPPTEAASPTPLPTFTPEPLLIPTLPALSTPTTVAASGGECNGPINMAEASGSASMKRIRIENATKAQITVSLYLNKNLFGQCGYIARSLAKNQSTILDIPPGTWWAAAFVNGPKPSQPNGVGFILGPSKTNDLLRLIVSADKIKYVGP